MEQPISSMSYLSTSFSSSDQDENQELSRESLLEDVRILKQPNPVSQDENQLPKLNIPNTPKTPKQLKIYRNGQTTPKTPSQLLMGTPFAQSPGAVMGYSEEGAVRGVGEAPGSGGGISHSPFGSTGPGSNTWSAAGVDKDTIIISKDDFARVVELKSQFDKAQEELEASQARITELENALKATKREQDGKLREVFEDHLRSQEQVRRLSLDIQRQIERQSELQQRYEALDNDQQLLIRERDLMMAEHAGQAEELVHLRAHAERLAYRLEELNRMRLENDDGFSQSEDEEENDSTEHALDPESANLEHGDPEKAGDHASGNKETNGRSKTHKRSHRRHNSKFQEHVKQIAELQGHLRQVQTELIQEQNMNEMYCQTINNQRIDLEKLTATILDLQRLDERLMEVSSLSSTVGSSESRPTSDQEATESGNRTSYKAATLNVVNAWPTAVDQLNLQAELVQAKAALVAEKSRFHRFSVFALTFSTAAIILVLFALIYL